MNIHLAITLTEKLLDTVESTLEWEQRDALVALLGFAKERIAEMNRVRDHLRERPPFRYPGEAVYCPERLVAQEGELEQRTQPGRNHASPYTQRND